MSTDSTTLTELICDYAPDGDAVDTHAVARVTARRIIRWWAGGGDEAPHQARHDHVMHELSAAVDDEDLCVLDWSADCVEHVIDFLQDRGF